VNATQSEELCVSREPAPWWRLLARRESRRNPVPEAPPGELYVFYASARDEWGNVRFALYWRELWCSITEKGVESGTMKTQFFYCDDRELFPSWLARYDRIFDVRSGEEITEAIREASWR
jgi:hypothetical protein